MAFVKILDGSLSIWIYIYTDHSGEYMKYYVYELINSLDNSIIYVGKGTRYRMYIHVRRAKKKIPSMGENLKLRNKICSILKQNGTIVYNIIYRTDNDVDAYEKEINRINEIGISNLCNLKVGQMCPEEIYEMNKKRLLGRTLSEATKKKISNSLRGHEVSQETRDKLRKFNTGIIKAPRKKPFPKVINSSGEVYTIYKLKDFCKQHGIPTSTMSALLHGRRKRLRSGGWTVFNKIKQSDNT